MKNSPQEPAKWSEHLQIQEPPSSTAGAEVSFEDVSSPEPQCLSAPVQACEVVELEGEEALNKWKDAMDQRYFADSVMQALEGLGMTDLQELSPPEARTIDTDEKKLPS